MGITPRDHFIGLAIFFMLAIGGFSVISLINKGDASVSSDQVITGFADETQLGAFNNTLKEADYLTSNVTALQSNLNNVKVNTGITIISFAGALINTAWGLIKLIISMFFFGNVMMSAIATTIGVPVWAIPLGISILGIILVFSIVSLIFGREI